MKGGIIVLFLISLTNARPVTDITQPDFSLYHTKDLVFMKMYDIVSHCPSIMKVAAHTAGDSDYNTTLTTVMVEPGGLTTDHSGKVRLLLNFGEHGRELISSELALSLLEKLCTASINNVVFIIVPMENERGREKVENGQLCERKNGRGVDPNRNWDIHWGYKEKDYDPQEEYPGAHAFSEPEVEIVRGIATSFKPHVWISFHSGMEALFMPWDHKNEVPTGKGAEKTLEILKELNTRVCKGACTVGCGGKSVGYLAHGTATDYMYANLSVPLAMTWEVYGDQKAHYLDCYRMFNPISRVVYRSVLERWSGAIFELLSLLPGHPDIPEDFVFQQSYYSGSSAKVQFIKRRGGLGWIWLAALILLAALNLNRLGTVAALIRHKLSKISMHVRRRNDIPV